MAASYGDRGTQKAIELVFTVVLNGERSDPAQALAVQAFTKVRRLLQKHPCLWESFSTVWELQKDTKQRIPSGPSSRMHILLRK